MNNGLKHICLAHKKFTKIYFTENNSAFEKVYMHHEDKLLRYIYHRALFGDPLLHAIDEPAVLFEDGSEWWVQEGKFHREDGPAIICEDGNYEYWLNNEQLSADEFNAQNINKILSPTPIWGPAVVALAGVFVARLIKNNKPIEFHAKSNAMEHKAERSIK